MAKRFTDTEKWFDPWYRKLGKDYKLLWNFCCDRCDMAGVMDFDLEAVCFLTGAKVTEANFFSVFSGRIVRLNGSRIWITKFIEFQYGKPISGLNPGSKVHGAVLNLVEKYALSEIPESVIPSPTQEPPAAAKIREAKPRITFTAPTVEEVIVFFKADNFPESLARQAFNYYQAADWHDSKGNQVRNWKQKMIAVWFKDENRQGPKAKPVYGEPAPRRSTYHCPKCDTDHRVSDPCPGAGPVVDVVKALEAQMKVTA